MARQWGQGSKRRKGADGRVATPALAEFVGGPLTSSMPLVDRVHLIMHILPRAPRLKVHSFFSETLDAVMYLGTGLQPSTKLSSLCESLEQLSGHCMAEYMARVQGNTGVTRDLLGMIESCNSEGDQLGLVDVAVNNGFHAFDGGRSPEEPSYLAGLVRKVAALERMVELARHQAAAAKSNMNTAMLKARQASLELAIQHESSVPFLT